MATTFMRSFRWLSVLAREASIWITGSVVLAPPGGVGGRVEEGVAVADGVGVIVLAGFGATVGATGTLLTTGA